MTLNQNKGKRNSLLWKFCFSYLFFQVICQSIIISHAIAPPVVEEPVVVVVEEYAEEVELSPMQDPLTPEGNLTLVDDIFTNNEGDKQFITAVSKNGNWFYLVIDRAGDNNNVYLLNMVDEADLMALLEGEPVSYDFGIEEEIDIPEPEPEPEIEEEVVEEKTEQESSIMPLIGLGLLGGGAAFYFLKVKPSQVPKGNPMFDDMDEDEDEEEEQDD